MSLQNEKQNNEKVFRRARRCPGPETDKLGGLSDSDLGPLVSQVQAGER